LGIYIWGTGCGASELLEQELTNDYLRLASLDMAVTMVPILPLTAAVLFVSIIPGHAVKTHGALYRLMAVSP